MLKCHLKHDTLNPILNAVELSVAVIMHQVLGLGYRVKYVKYLTCWPIHYLSHDKDASLSDSLLMEGRLLLDLTFTACTYHFQLRIFLVRIFFFSVIN